jgi:hypothetical protein
MKKALLLLILCHNYLNGQLYVHDFCFDPVVYCPWSDYVTEVQPILTVDSNANPNNIWQIGIPQKPILNNAWSIPNVIITDTIYSYPVNDTSSFIIEGIATHSSSSILWFNFNLSFQYFVDSDTLTDFGKIEFSPDNGTTWIDLLSHPLCLGYWIVSGTNYEAPVLTGTSGGWVYTTLNMRELGIYLDIQPGTIFKWRFTFISDAMQSNRDGLMYDNIFIEISPPIGLEEVDLNANRKLIKVIDMLGNEAVTKSNTILIYLYDDGSTEKVFNVE